MYSVMKMCADGVERKKTLGFLAREIESNDPETIVEVVSKKKGRIWCGHARHLDADLRDDFLKHCVQEIEEDEYGVTVIMR